MQIRADGLALAETAERTNVTAVDGGGTTRQRTEHSRGPWYRLSATSLVVLLVGLAITAGLSWLANELNERNEQRLLNLETKQVATVLQVFLPTIQTPLAASAQAAAASSGSANDFKTYITPYIGKTGVFASASLWRISGKSATLISRVGATPVLANNLASASRFLTGAAKSPTLVVTQPLAPTSKSPRLGYAYVAGKGPTKYAAYAESALSPGRKAPPQPRNSPFSDLRNYAIYIGKERTDAALLSSNLDPKDLPINGRTAAATVPFGSSALTLVASSNGNLGGSLSGRLWWILAIAGTILALAAAVVAERLVRRRHAAERLTGEVAHLLREQRNIAETLQRALLPKQVPELPGVHIAMRYIPGEHGVEIGGDWYDLIPLDDRRFFFVVGDVSGRGVTAGSVMASLHFAIRGFVSEGHSPEKVLTTLAGLLNVSRDQHFATVLCGIADVEQHVVTFANAGHLPPLLVGNGTREFVRTQVGPPIGVGTRPVYEPVTVTVPPGGLFLAYTDGLVERRGESLDAGLSRLESSVAVADGSLEDLLDTVAADLAQDGQEDDTAILGVKWLS
ncbi:MAG TPA: PP2C family protein-serine/threonine phosphatase [Jatrophihabitantaceae bacterium]|nr:PP2C family protein-serine/threonine phosphatase [Jatrophihabitantaceae bacterium]